MTPFILSVYACVCVSVFLLRFLFRIVHFFGLSCVFFLLQFSEPWTHRMTLTKSPLGRTNKHQPEMNSQHVSMENDDRTMNYIPKCHNECIETWTDVGCEFILWADMSTLEFQTCTQTHTHFMCLLYSSHWMLMYSGYRCARNTVNFQTKPTNFVLASNRVI